MGKERSSNTNTLASQPKPAVILPKTVEQANPTYLESGYFHDLLFLANQASADFYRQVVVAPEESLTGRVEKHAWKQREAGGKQRDAIAIYICQFEVKDIWDEMQGNSEKLVVNSEMQLLYIYVNLK
ncbi:uncharacterized protein LOC108827077 [Raphanus sativus]|uniref:Uncharacterized protein LOC108827077 n=1 Tax=Raphanus sativus TaxID=3726 RepID=A0A6J0L6S6_RAPSA|nr:uncharacterized protein LOC108827077 [Raphanus sativus]